MPPITLHMILANRLAEGLAIPELAAMRGPYLLGATAPDIRVITRTNRRETHFFDVAVFDHQDSVSAFFGAQGHLADPARVEEDLAGERHHRGVLRRPGLQLWSALRQDPAGYEPRRLHLRPRWAGADRR